MNARLRFEITPLSHPELSVWHLPDPPSLLHAECKSESHALSLLSRLPTDGLAVVGSRNPPLSARSLTRSIIHELRSFPLIIVSGFAEGIDTEAHLASAQSGLPTLAILGCGLDRVSTQSQRKLRRQIVDTGGIILSEFPDGMPAQKHQFLFRNRLIAGLARATWVVQARERSGTLNTARWARDSHRDVYATPCAPGESFYAGNQKLLDRDHAYTLWGAHSLGSTWLELSRINSNSDRLHSVQTLAGLPKTLYEHLETPRNFHHLIQNWGDEVLPALETLERMRLIHEELGVIRRF